MLVDLQQTLIQSLEAELTTPVQSGRVKPKAIKPYEGQLQEPKARINVVPIVYVEVDLGGVGRAARGSNELKGGVEIDVHCVHYNAATGPYFNDAVGLVTWVAEALTVIGTRMEIPNYGEASWDEMTFRRMLSGREYYAAALRPEVEATPRNP